MPALIEDWKQGWKYWSVQLSTLGLGFLSFADVVNQALMAVPPVLGLQIPHAKSIGIVLVGLGIISRFLQQGNKSNEKAN